MSTYRLLFSEIGFRRMSFVLCLLAVAVAAALLIAGPTLISAYSQETDERVRAHNQATNRRIREQEERCQQELQAANRRIREQEEECQRELKDLRQRTSDELAAKKEQLDGKLTMRVFACDKKLADMQKENDRLLAEMDKKTKRLMRDLGFNLRIVHRDTNMGDLYTNFVLAEMPEEYVYTLANAEQIDKIVHLVATLQEKIKWENRTVLLVGILPEVSQSHIESKAPMGYRIEPGTVYVGHELGFDRKVGEKIEIQGNEFEIAEILPEQGTHEDVMLAVHLHDAQKVVDKPKKIHQIMALGCHCAEATLANLRKQLETVLPDTRITEHRTRRVARAEQRDLVVQKRDELIAKTTAGNEQLIAETKQGNLKILQETEAHNQQLIREAKEKGDEIIAGLKDSRLAVQRKGDEIVAGLKNSRLAVKRTLLNSRRAVQRTLTTMVAVTTPLVTFASAVFVGLMFWTNVRERRPEIGILRALGKGGLAIAGLFLGKAILIGLVGGVVGCVCGYLLAWVAGSTMDITAGDFRPDAVWLAVALLGTPLIAAAASYLPTLAAVRQDPAIVLQDQ